MTDQHKDILSLRQLAYRDAIRDAVKKVRDFKGTCSTPEILNFCDYAVQLIRSCKRSYK